MRLIDIFKGTKNNSSQVESKPPRLHHYQFAYRALPGLAFADPYVPLGFGHDTPKGSLVKFWKQVGTHFPENERFGNSGLIASDSPFGPDYVIVLVTMPTPLRVSEAYYVAIIYPRSWFESPAYENTRPDLQVFILAMSNVTNAGEVSSGTLRALTKTGHGALKFGVPATVEAFLKEIQIALQNPYKWISRVDSQPWKFEMRDGEMAQSRFRAQTIEPPTQTPKFRGKLLVLDAEEGPRECMRVIFENEYDLFMAEDGPTAIELAMQNDVDVAVLNIRMARMSGIEVLERLKSLKPDIEVIMMTGFETNDTRRESLRLASAFL
jgi:CheY-like chemotaxis protein